MAHVSNFEINERLNIKRSNLSVTTIGNKNWENWFISKDKYENLRNCEDVMRNVESTKNSKIANFWKWILFCQFEKFQKFRIRKIWKIWDFEKSKISQFCRFEKFGILKFLKISDCQNFKSFQIAKFLNWKILKNLQF